ncbi:MAG: efflux RND transporter periplasmic adaptor subunit [Bauldia sp.]|nr:efflux RND transporter periplasmic adaptor subunit [Bauldia sp.]
MSLRFFSAAAIVLTVVALAGCKPEEPPPAPPRAARVIEAQPAPLMLSAEGSGTINSRTTTTIGFLVAGRMNAREVDVGSKVAVEEVIATIDPTDFQNQLDAAAGQVDAAQASVTQTSAEEAAKRQLLKEGFTTQAEYNDALRAYQTAQADLASAQANLRLAQDQLRYTTLKSPVAGVVTRTGADPGQVVQAGQMIVEIADDGALDAVFSVPAQIANLAKIGGKVSIWLQQNPDVKVIGSVRQISPNADPTTGTYTVKVALENPPAEMRLGSLVRGRAEQLGSDVVSIPPKALVQTGDEPQVWIVSADGKVHLTPVTVARYDTDAVMISKGIAQGDLVVIAGVNSLAEGQVVTIEKVTPQ